MNNSIITIKELIAAYPYLKAAYHERLLEDLKLMIANIAAESYLEGYKEASQKAIDNLQDLSELA